VVALATIYGGREPLGGGEGSRAEAGEEKKRGAARDDDGEGTMRKEKKRHVQVGTYETITIKRRQR
jgi:hypothetical protein